MSDLIEGIVKIITGILVLIIISGLAACQPLSFGERVVKVNARQHFLEVVLDRIGGMVDR